MCKSKRYSVQAAVLGLQVMFLPHLGLLGFMHPWGKVAAAGRFHHSSGVVTAAERDCGLPLHADSEAIATRNAEKLEARILYEN